MIRNVTGDLLRDDADALVNTVYTAGIMGKGLALQFKKAWPDMYADYAAACARGEVELGRVHVWKTGSRYILNFPTKDHWRSRSKLKDIESGLHDLVRFITEEKIRSIAVPPLGCGLGGLYWTEVEPLIHQVLAPIAAQVEVRVFV
jgi:O-acetyl-ADP-ribose deacetylase (regulator of RNase III)